jgi:myo-inositol-1(or 4)-monophosphatase
MERQMLQTVLEIAEEAGRLALGYFETRGDLPVTSKAHLNLVTEADRAVETFIAGRLQLAFPEDGIFGEEGAGQSGSSGRTWVVDPIDGTFNFVRGGDQWAISIGLFEAGAPTLGVIHAPLRGATLAGGPARPPTLDGTLLPGLSPFVPGRAAIAVGLDYGTPDDAQVEALRYLMQDAGIVVRSCNSATIAMLEVATGEADAYLAMSDASWDVMAGWAILTGLGATASFDWGDVPLTARLRFAIGKPKAIDRLAPLGLGQPRQD